MLAATLVVLALGTVSRAQRCLGYTPDSAGVTCTSGQQISPYPLERTVSPCPDLQPWCRWAHQADFESTNGFISGNPSFVGAGGPQWYNDPVEVEKTLVQSQSLLNFTRDTCGYGDMSSTNAMLTGAISPSLIGIHTETWGPPRDGLPNQGSSTVCMGGLGASGSLTVALNPSSDGTCVYEPISLSSKVSGVTAVVQLEYQYGYTYTTNIHVENTVEASNSHDHTSESSHTISINIALTEEAEPFGVGTSSTQFLQTDFEGSTSDTSTTESSTSTMTSTDTSKQYTTMVTLSASVNQLAGSICTINYAKRSCTYQISDVLPNSLSGTYRKAFVPTNPTGFGTTHADGVAQVSDLGSGDDLVVSYTYLDSSVSTQSYSGFYITCTPQVSSDGKCGAAAGGTGETCAGSPFASCCSASGNCVKAGFGCQSSTSPKNACQPGFGICPVAPSTDGGCGGSTGFTCAGQTDFGPCCSKSTNQCGSEDECAPTDCNPALGLCGPHVTLDGSCGKYSYCDSSANSTFGAYCVAGQCQKTIPISTDGSCSTTFLTAAPSFLQLEMSCTGSLFGDYCVPETGKCQPTMPLSTTGDCGFNSTSIRQFETNCTGTATPFCVDQRCQAAMPTSTIRNCGFNTTTGFTFPEYEHGCGTKSFPYCHLGRCERALPISTTGACGTNYTSLEWAQTCTGSTFGNYCIAGTCQTAPPVSVDGTCGPSPTSEFRHTCSGTSKPFCHNRKCQAALPVSLDGRCSSSPVKTEFSTTCVGSKFGNFCVGSKCQRHHKRSGARVEH